MMVIPVMLLPEVCVSFFSGLAMELFGEKNARYNMVDMVYFGGNGI